MGQGALARKVDLRLLRELTRALSADLLLLREDDLPAAARDDAEVCVPYFYATHAHGDPKCWGWQPGAGVVRKMAGPDLLGDDYHLVWDCEATVLLLGELAAVAARVRELCSARVNEGFALLSPVVKLALGSSAHSGDFLWRP